MTAASTPRLPGYTVERLLGRGGSGEVWSARVTATGERVALKWIPATSASAPSEAAVLTALDHPHLVRVHDVVPDARGAALVLDLADGGSLGQLLAIRGRLSPGEVVSALAPVASALAHAHANGVVHGDVSPANILFSAAGSPMLADLGLARLRGDRPVADDGPRCTPQYVDPSVARGFVPAPPSDVFMLAAVAVHALTGDPLWRGSDDAALGAAERGDLHDLPDRLRAAHVPTSVADVVLRATSLDPAQRGTAAEFALDLRAAADAVPVDLTAGRRATPPPSTGPRHAAPSAAAPVGAALTRLVRPHPRPTLPTGTTPPRRLRWWGAAAALAAVLVAGGLAWALTGSSGSGATKHNPPTRALPGANVPGVDESLATPGPATTQAGGSVASNTQTPLTLTADQAATVLQQLDVLRQHAYERRAPLLLTGVYLPGKLLDADTALLAKLVPDGCGLEGVHTAYDQVTLVTRTAGQIVVSARSTLSPSVLICEGKPVAQAPGSGPDTVQVTLVWRGHGYLIGAVLRTH